MNRKSAYSSAILLIFLRNIGKHLESITQVTNFADKQMEQLGIKNDLSESTKYSIVKELIDSGILFIGTRKSGKKQTVHLSKKVAKYFMEE